MVLVIELNHESDATGMLSDAVVLRCIDRTTRSTDSLVATLPVMSEGEEIDSAMKGQ
jgi:hypothetical protein